VRAAFLCFERLPHHLGRAWEFQPAPIRSFDQAVVRDAFWSLEVSVNRPVIFAPQVVDDCAKTPSLAERAAFAIRASIQTIFNPASFTQEQQTIASADGNAGL
jgi:hypothetical protein